MGRLKQQLTTEKDREDESAASTPMSKFAYKNHSLMLRKELVILLSVCIGLYREDESAASTPMSKFAYKNPRLMLRKEIEEVWSEITAMALDSAPGPDGFTGRFYTRFWDLIRVDLMAVNDGFFEGRHMPRSFTSIYLTMIPKVAHATLITQLRPISMCNFCQKIISRILTSRLASWFPRIISEEQAGFIKGRSIHENIALDHDITHDLNHKTFGGNLVIKLDMSKSYDTVSWHFILGILRSMGFTDSWVLNAAVEHGIVQPYVTKRRTVQVNHLLFADDLLIFTNGAKNSVRNLLDLIDDFCTVSGQRLNPVKSSIVFPASFPLGDRRSSSD
ncbi:hypothetical protein QQ045_024569 [Rhodiola kirilowii]